VSVADDVEMVFFGSAAPQRLFGPYRVGDASDRGAAWWSPVTEGETLTVEFFAPNKHVAGDPRIVEVGHLFQSPADRAPTKAHLGHRRRRRMQRGHCVLAAQWQHGIPQRDGSRRADGLQRQAASCCCARARCSTTPILHAAAVVLRREPLLRQRFRAVQDRGADADRREHAHDPVVLRGDELRIEHRQPGFPAARGGATYLYSNQQSDALFLRLNRDPPAGAFFSGGTRMR
jgi:hypothetical protein